MAALPTPEYQAPEPSLERPKKRQKIAMACDTCRFRKVKCDGAKPICGICAKRKDKGVGCAYNRDKMKLSGVFDDDHQLSREYESSPLATDLLTEDPGTVSHRTPQERYSLGGKPRAKPLRFSEETVTTQEETGKGIDSMTGVGGDNSNNQQFFGSSSAGSFMKRIKAAIDVKIGMPQASPSEQETSRALYLLSPPTSNGRPQDENIEYVLPSRKTADNLTATYWTLVHPLYPFLDRQVFEDAYNSIWRGSQTGVDERMFMCMVNVIFALGSQLSQSIKAELRGPTAKVYFKRAQELLHLDLWSMGSIELVQTLLLMGQYLQSTTNPHQCWMVIGHAIRIAQGLGLHLAETSAELRSAREREVARRIWHGCIMMDRILSMTLGRPAMISKPLADAVPLPAMVDYEPDSSAMGMLDAHNESRPAMMAFYIKSLHLYGIINDILLALYMGQQRTPQEDNSISLFDRDNSCDITKVFQLDQALMKWGQTMPQHLRVSSYESAQSEIFLRQAVVCRARFLHARILLYRPILSDFCLPQSPPTELGTVIDESLAERMVLQCSTLCLRSAHDLIGLIHANLDLETSNGPLPAWWYCVLYVYTAATVLLAARLRPAITAGVPNYSITESWGKAIDILRAFQCFGQSAKRSVAALEILASKVPLDSIPSDEEHDVPRDQAPTVAPTPANAADQTAFDDFHGIEFQGITFDLNDMSWLTSLPGNL